MAEARTAVVTGASSGVGAAIARAFGALGWNVAIGARRVERLEEVAGAINAAGGKAFVSALDVSEPESIDAFFAASENKVGATDVVVSNAGIGTPGLIHELTIDDLRKEMMTNLFGTMLVVRRALPSMLERRRGDVVLLSSTAVSEPRPFQAGYSATKGGIEGFAQGLRCDLEGTGVRTTVIRLGPTRSEFGNGWDPVVLGRMIETWQRWGFLRHMEMMEPEDVAQAVVASVTSMRGFSMNLVQLNPDGSSRATE